MKCLKLALLISVIGVVVLAAVVDKMQQHWSEKRYARLSIGNSG